MRGFPASGSPISLGTAESLSRGVPGGRPCSSASGPPRPPRRVPGSRAHLKEEAASGRNRAAPSLLSVLDRAGAPIDPTRRRSPRWAGSRLLERGDVAASRPWRCRWLSSAGKNPLPRRMVAFGQWGLDAAEAGWCLDEAGTNDELDELGRASQRTVLSRLHVAYEGQRRFSGDASAPVADTADDPDRTDRGCRAKSDRGEEYCRILSIGARACGPARADCRGVDVPRR